jgi:hypothetical protein
MAGKLLSDAELVAVLERNKWAMISRRVDGPWAVDTIGKPNPHDPMRLLNECEADRASLLAHIEAMKERDRWVPVIESPQEAGRYIVTVQHERDDVPWVITSDYSRCMANTYRAIDEERNLESVKREAAAEARGYARAMDDVEHQQKAAGRWVDGLPEAMAALRASVARLDAPKPEPEPDGKACMLCGKWHAASLECPKPEPAAYRCVYVEHHRESGALGTYVIYKTSCGGYREVGPGDIWCAGCAKPIKIAYA